jgi:hypothetical protein
MRRHFDGMSRAPHKKQSEKSSKKPFGADFDLRRGQWAIQKFRGEVRQFKYNYQGNGELRRRSSLE